MNLDFNQLSSLQFLFESGALDEIRNRIVNDSSDHIFSTREHERAIREQCYLEGVGAIKFYNSIQSIVEEFKYSNKKEDK